MAGSIGIRYAPQRREPIVHRSAAELSAKCADEHFVAREASIDRNLEDGRVAGNEPGGGACESQPLRVLLWSFTSEAAECAVESKCRLSGVRGQGLQRKVLVEPATDVLQQV